MFVSSSASNYYTASHVLLVFPVFKTRESQSIILKSDISLRCGAFLSSLINHHLQHLKFVFQKKRRTDRCLSVLLPQNIPITTSWSSSFLVPPKFENLSPCFSNKDIYLSAACAFLSSLTNYFLQHLKFVVQKRETSRTCFLPGCAQNLCTSMACSSAFLVFKTLEYRSIFVLSLSSK